MKFTPWFSMKVSPVRVGAYEVGPIGRGRFFSYWNGAYWNGSWRSIDLALRNKYRYCPVCRYEQWRGVTERGAEMAPQILEGWVMVPKEPTKAMAGAANRFANHNQDLHAPAYGTVPWWLGVLRAAVAAAPKPGDES